MVVVISLHILDKAKVNLNANFFSTSSVVSNMMTVYLNKIKVLP